MDNPVWVPAGSLAYNTRWARIVLRNDKFTIVSQKDRILSRLSWRVLLMSRNYASYSRRCNKTMNLVKTKALYTVMHTTHFRWLCRNKNHLPLAFSTNICQLTAHAFWVKIVIILKMYPTDHR